MSKTAFLPAVLSWRAPERPLPVRNIRYPSDVKPRTIGLEAPPWLASGPVNEPFDFGERIRCLCADISLRCEELRHIDASRLLFGVTQARSGQKHGLQARVTPLRFRGGMLRKRRGRTTYQVQRYFVDGQEMLYLVTFCLPRFLEQGFDEKFITLFHELYHISPAFEGDLRRMEGRCHMHSHSKSEFDARMAALARAYLAGGAAKDLHGFLRMDFAQLKHRHGEVEGVVVPRPRLLPAAD